MFLFILVAFYDWLNSMTENVIFFPYNKDKYFDKYEDAILDSDIFIDYFPFLNQKNSRKLKDVGKKWIGYISIYKAPIISQLEKKTGFIGGSPTLEEVEENPYWNSVSLDKYNYKLIELKKPFNKPQYKNGWYVSSLSDAKTRHNILFGINKLLDFGLDGVFIDNIIDRKIENNLQSKVLENIAKTVHHKNGKIIINVGRQALETLNVAADIYVAENFCYGRKTNPDKYYFAGKHLELKELKKELEKTSLRFTNLKTKILTYTKTPNYLDEEKRVTILNRSQELADDYGFLWTTSLKEINLIKHLNP